MRLGLLSVFLPLSPSSLERCLGPKMSVNNYIIVFHLHHNSEETSISRQSLNSFT